MTLMEACGWKKEGSYWTHTDGRCTKAHFGCKNRDCENVLCGKNIPKYFSDLNAITEVVRAKFGESGPEADKFCKELEAVVQRDRPGGTRKITSWDLLGATACQWCEAFLRTLDLWEEATTRGKPHPSLTPIVPTYRPPTHHRARPVYVFNAAEMTAFIALMGELSGNNPIPREFYRDQAHEFLQCRQLMVLVTPKSVAKVALMIKDTRRHLIPRATLKAHVPEYVTESGEMIPTLLEKATAQLQALFPKGKIRPQEVEDEVIFRPNKPLAHKHLADLMKLPQEIEVEVTHHPRLEIALRIQNK
jgi:hypothetical protein